MCDHHRKFHVKFIQLDESVKWTNTEIKCGESNFNLTKLDRVFKLIRADGIAIPNPRNKVDFYKALMTRFGFH